MNKFARKLDRIELLSARMSQSPQWWQDLLLLWRPSGHASGDHGLRLAIRDNKMNFYRCGQSIAQVEISRDGQPVARTHVKYLAAPEEKEIGKDYVKLQGDFIVRKGHPLRAYQGIEEIKSWIKTIDGELGSGRKGFVGAEKLLIDQVVAVNPGVIDLEMGLPAWGNQKTPIRMDLVDIEVYGGRASVVFWEAKRISDSRIRCSNLIKGKTPEVLQQLNNYRLFLAEENHRRLVTVAYRQAAILLQQLHEMVPAATRTQFPLAGVIQEVHGRESLAVDETARLLVFNERNTNQDAWEVHAHRLAASNVRMQVVDDGGPFILKRLA